MSMNQLFLVLGMLAVVTAGALCLLCEVVSKIQKRVSVLEEMDADAQWKRLEGFRFELSPAELAASRIEARSDETPQEVRPVGQEPDGDSRDAQTPSGDPR
jgi:hypothetical protein